MAEDFRIACERNALRRAGGLPLLNIRAAMAEEADRRAWRAYNEAWQVNQPIYDRIREGVFSGLRSRHGGDFGTSMGWRMAVGVMTAKSFEKYLASIGIKRPAIKGVVYGRSRESEADQ